MPGVKAGKGSAKPSLFVDRLNFSKSLFPTQGDVTSFLNKKGYEGFEIVDEKDVWAAKSTESTDGLTLSAKARTQPTTTGGVTISVKEIIEAKAADDTGEADDGEGEANAQAGAKKAKVREVIPVADEKQKGGTAKGASAPAPEDEEDESAEETDTVLAFPPELAAKYDYWSSYMSNEGSLLGVLKDGMDYDSIPPGTDEVMSALYFTTGNILGAEGDLAGKSTLLKQAGEDYAALVVGLAELFDTATAAAKDAKDPHHESAKRFIKAYEESRERAKSLKGSINFGNVTETAKTEAAAPVIEPGRVEVTSVAPADTSGAVIAAIRSMETRLSRRIRTVEKKAEDAAQGLAPKADKVEGEPSSTAKSGETSRAPLRKSLAGAADDFGVESIDVPDEAKKGVLAERRKDLLGMFGGRRT